jgi:hypothetical protein
MSSRFLFSDSSCKNNNLILFNNIHTLPSPHIHQHLWQFAGLFEQEVEANQPPWKEHALLVHKFGSGLWSPVVIYSLHSAKQLFVPNRLGIFLQCSRCGMFCWVECSENNCEIKGKFTLNLLDGNLIQFAQS